jgi:hypothetical protein
MPSEDSKQASHTTAKQGHPANQQVKPNQQVSAPLTEPKMPPPNTDCGEAKECKKHWLDYATFGVEIFGLILVAIYATLTYGIFQQNKNTVTEMQLQTRIDERPWVKFSAPDNWETVSGRAVAIKAGQPIQVPIQFTNYGKTASRQNIASMTEEIVPVGQEPEIPEDSWTLSDNPNAPPGQRLMAVYPSQTLRIGVINPGEPIDLSVSRVKLTGRDFSIDPPTQGEITKLISGQAYIAVWGIVRYGDIFGTPHETKFCRAIPKSATLPKCADYNDVDSNNGTQPSN